ncbi:MAG TPA: PDZ domain-containing protein [Tepidisphaeraceae bacterium]|jgi:hypothetical protein
MTAPRAIAAAVAFAALTTSAFAQTQPATQPAQVEVVRTERICYLGVATSPAAPSLREQLGLARGVGLVVEMVDDNSPAKTAGLLRHDVIHTFDGQMVINVHQLTALVRMHKPGDRVKLNVIRRGQPLDVEVELIEREVPVLENNALLPPEAFANQQAGRITGILTHNDGKNIFILVNRGDDRQIIVKDTSNKLVYIGPLNTSDDRVRVPEALRAKVDVVEKTGDRVKNLRPAAPVPPADATAPAAP